MKIQFDVIDRFLKFFYDFLGFKARAYFASATWRTQDFRYRIETGGIEMIRMETLQTQNVVVKFKDRRGNPAKVENVRWMSNDESIATIVSAVDRPEAQVTEAHAIITSLDVVGSASVECEADPILGPEEGSLRAVAVVVVAAPEASVSEIEAEGEPTDIPEEGGEPTTPPVE